MLMKEQEDFLSFPSEEDFWRNQLANVDWTKSCPNNVACWKKDLHQSFVTSQETEWKELLQQHQEQIEAKPELDDVSKFLLLRKLFHKFGQGEFSVEDAREIFNLCQWNCSETEKIRIIKIIQFKKWHTDFESQLKLLQQEPQQSILRAQLLKNTLQREASAFVFSQPEEAFRNPITQKNITSMHKLVEDAGAKSYFVQYPTLPTADLSKLLAGLNTRVIDNQSNFQAALAKYRYEELFVDKFGGSFGHATKLGNEILVESILKTLESEKVISK